MYPIDHKDEILDINSFNLMSYIIYDNEFFPTYDKTNEFFHFGEIFTENKRKDSESEENEPRERVLLFNVEKKDKYRGRKRKESKLNYGHFIHSKDTSDNLLRKIQIHYMTFIVDYSNAILKKYGYRKKEDFFVNISSDFKENIKKDNINLLKKSNIGYVLCQNISSKFTTMRNDKNIKIFEKVTENNIIKHLLSENYLQLFKDVYHKNKRIIYFKIGDYSDIIDLTNTKMFEDLLKKNINEKEDYKEKLKKSVNMNYIK